MLASRRAVALTMGKPARGGLDLLLDPGIFQNAVCSVSRSAGGRHRKRQFPLGPDFMRPLARPKKSEAIIFQNFYDLGVIAIHAAHMRKSVTGRCAAPSR